MPGKSRGRVVAAILAAFVIVDVAAGFLAYYTPTWNFSRTEVLTGWDNVVQVCLIMMPLVVAVFLLVGGLMVWALSDD